MQRFSHANRAGFAPISNSTLNGQSAQNLNLGTRIAESFSDRVTFGDFLTSVLTSSRVSTP